jgi:hypothetical protein
MIGIPYWQLEAEFARTERETLTAGDKTAKAVVKSLNPSFTKKVTAKNAFAILLESLKQIPMDRVHELFVDKREQMAAKAGVSVEEVEILSKKIFKHLLRLP